jgi:hypothetical protein
VPICGNADLMHIKQGVINRRKSDIEIRIQHIRVSGSFSPGAAATGRLVAVLGLGAIYGCQL